MTRKSNAEEAERKKRENILSKIGMARKLVKIVRVKAQYLNEPLRNSTFEDLEEINQLLDNSQKEIKRL